MRRSVHQKESFVHLFVQSCFRVAVNHSVSRSDSLPPSAPRSHSRIANASQVVQTHFLPPPLVLVRESRMPAESFTHFLPPPLVLVRESRMPAESFRLTSSLRPSFSFANRECQPSRSDSLPPSVPRSRSRIANASRVGQTHFLPRSQHSNESQMHNAVLTAESRSDSLVLISQTNHKITIHNGANGYQSTQH